MWTVPSPSPMNHSSTKAPGSVRVSATISSINARNASSRAGLTASSTTQDTIFRRMERRNDRAVHVDLVDLDDGRELRCLVLHRHRREQIGIGGEEGAAVEPNRLVDVRDDEDEADVGIGDDVAVPVDPPVEDADGARGVALRRDVAVAVRIDVAIKKNGAAVMNDSRSGVR